MYFLNLAIWKSWGILQSLGYLNTTTAVRPTKDCEDKGLFSQEVVSFDIIFRCTGPNYSGITENAGEISLFLSCYRRKMFKRFPVELLSSSHMPTWISPSGLALMVTLVACGSWSPKSTLYLDRWPSEKIHWLQVKVLPKSPSRRSPGSLDLLFHSVQFT